MITITTPMWIAATPVMLAGLLLIRNYLFPKKPRKKIVYGTGIAITTYPEDRPQNFNQWILFLRLRYDLRFKPNPNYETKEINRINLTSK